MTEPQPLRATARLQFHAGFTLEAAVPLVPYFRRLGISHVYASPLLKARPGSTHGYDIVDPDRINPELGGEEALHRLVAALRAHGMGLILDIVPNHMGVGGADNGWWLDVLEWGRRSPFAEFFDVDWDPPDPGLRDKLLAPFLGAPYGEALESGALTFHFEAHSGKFHVSYYEHRFPIAPRTYAEVLSATNEPALEGIAQTFRALAMGGSRDAARAASGLALDLLARHAATTEGGAQVNAVVAAHDAKTTDGRARLHALLEMQNYRLAWWRAATDEINWRRFFDITSLGGLQVERPRVFDATHATILRLYADGLIDGVRVDHVDGLADPRAYCRKLRRRLTALEPTRPPGAPRDPALLVVEKILAPNERLRRDWLVDGTTGYDFMDSVAAVLHDPAGEAPLTDLWHAHTGRPRDFAEEARDARRHILRYNLASELNGTSAALRRIASRDLATRDFTLTAIRRALTEVLVHFPAYRSYVGHAGRGEGDERLLARAMAGARRTVRATERPLLELLNGWLGGDPPRTLPTNQRRERWRTAIRFQQLSAPVAAKSVEDTAFYRYGRLISRNEVGSEPAHLALSPAAFHAGNRERAKHFPRQLLATATHDHKRGEDARLRLAVLSELPEEWSAALTRWTRLNAPLKKEVEGEPAPDATDELMLYQSIVGAWPMDLDPADDAGVEDLIARLTKWQEKALREGKRRSDWAAPNEAYEAACHDFLRAVLAPDRVSRLRDDVAAFVNRIAPAGALNGLSQVVLRCTAPGIPDLYQGTEFWDLSLVDPDNRRPVDFPARIAALDAAAPPADLVASWRDGRVKAAILARALDARTRHAPAFAEGEYLALEADGPLAAHVLAFARRAGDATVITVATRLAARLPGTGAAPRVAPETWAETALILPDPLSAATFRDAMTGETFAPGARLPLASLLRHLPVALLEPA